MIGLKGRNGEGKIFAEQVDDNVVGQALSLLNSDVTEGTKVRIMPDAHFGKGALVGTTIKLPEDRRDWKVSPNVVGVDIGCGMMAYKLKEHDLNLEQVDRNIKQNVPSGFNHLKTATNDANDFLKKYITQSVSSDLYKDKLPLIPLSMGTLGGGNHFIDITRDENDDLWLTVHSGSRNLGIQIASSFQEVAERLNPRPEGLSFLQGDALDEYLNDMKLGQEFAHLNRQTMLNNIVKVMGWHVEDSFDSIHNYIDIENGIIRKGSTDATKDKRLIIPMNMQFGSIIAEGKGNDDWNNSAPHGAGRVLSRSKAKKILSMDDFKEDMNGIYTTTAVQSTIDEAPEAYKKPEDILSQIGDTVTIKHIIKPLYNFKGM